MLTARPVLNYVIDHPWNDSSPFPIPPMLLCYGTLELGLIDHHLQHVVEAGHHVLESIRPTSWSWLHHCHYFLVDNKYQNTTLPLRFLSRTRSLSLSFDLITSRMNWKTVANLLRSTNHRHFHFQFHFVLCLNLNLQFFQ